MTIVPEFLDRFAVGSVILLRIDQGTILNVLSSVGVFDRVQSLVQIVLGGRHATNHDCVVIVAQKSLEQTSEL